MFEGAGGGSLRGGACCLWRSPLSVREPDPRTRVHVHSDRCPNRHATTDCSHHPGAYPGGACHAHDSANRDADNDSNAHPSGDRHTASRLHPHSLRDP
ncbi:MAG: hypothetical protein OXG61_01685 [Chloroflexi bacterium]|nr:hypothetical protein [Chloroflexota bacterium]